MARRGPNFSRFVLNCESSRDTESDWSFGDAVAAQSELMQDPNSSLKLFRAEDLTKPPPASVDLRRDWWKIQDQGKTGACVGYATADGLLRWQYVKHKMMSTTERPSPRFIWMANKETDDFTRYPTTFIERAGTSTKLALGIAQKFGCVPESMLPMNGPLSPLRANVFFSIAAQFRITAYYNLGKELDHWRRWIAYVGPVLTRLDVDKTWKNATATNGKLDKYDEEGTKFGGHAVCLVGFTASHFLVRNSWGSSWGDNGYAYASIEYADKAFKEAYGAVI